MAATASGKRTVLRVARLFDGRSERCREQMAVVIEGRRIVDVCPQHELAPEHRTAPAGGSQSRIVDECTRAEPAPDLAGASLLPGLVDAHCHTTLPGDGRAIEAAAADGDGLHLLAGVRNARLALESGVTTLGDAGGWHSTVLSLREGIARGLVTGPRILAAGRPLTITGGHCWMMGGQADGVEAVRRAVRRLVAEGADFIKVMASGGGTAGSIKGVSAYTPAELRAAVDEAHRLGRRVVAHAIALPAMLDALDAGVDGLAHCMFLQPDGTVEFRIEVAERIAAAGVWVTPTLDELWAPFCELERRSHVAQLDSDERQLLDVGRRRLETHAQVCRQLIQAGVRLAAGSDAGWKVCAFGQFYRELEALVTHAGLSPAQALLAGTRDAAGMLGVVDQVGTIEVGKEADLLLVRGDPTRDVTAVTQVLAVFQAGERVR